MPRKRFIALGLVAFLWLPWMPSKSTPASAMATTVPKTSANAFYNSHWRDYRRVVDSRNGGNKYVKKAPKTGPNFPKTLYDPSEIDNIAEARANRELLKDHLAHLKQGLKLPLFPDPKSELSFIYLRELARLSVRDGNLKQLDGDYSGAMTAYLDAYALGQQLWGGKTLITDMIGVLLEGIGLMNADVAVAHLSASEARTALERLDGMLANRPRFVDLYATAHAQNLSRLRLETNPDFDEVTRMFGKMPLIRFANEGLITRYQNLTADQRVVAQKPYQQAKGKMELKVSEYDPLTLVAVSLNREHESYTLRTAMAQELKVRLALRIWQAEHHGALPKSLDALVLDGYLKALPADPYSYTGAESFPYDQATGKIWSVGPDGINNHGKNDDDPRELDYWGKQKK